MIASQIYHYIFISLYNTTLKRNPGEACNYYKELISDFSNKNYQEITKKVEYLIHNLSTIIELRDNNSFEENYNKLCLNIESLDYYKKSCIIKRNLYAKIQKTVTDHMI
jgi:hypothetical protein